MKVTEKQERKVVAYQLEMDGELLGTTRSRQKLVQRINEIARWDFRMAENLVAYKCYDDHTREEMDWTD